MYSNLFDDFDLDIQKVTNESLHSQNNALSGFSCTPRDCFSSYCTRAYPATCMSYPNCQTLNGTCGAQVCWFAG